MAMVASRELRNNTRSLIMRAKKGETIVITVDGEPVAELRPIENRRRWIPRDELFATLVQADPELRSALRQPSDMITSHEQREVHRRKPARRR